MKKILLLFFISANALAQNIDYNKIILPSNVQSADFGEKLVQLAWRNNPLNEVARRQVSIAEWEVRKNIGSWLDIFHAQGNLNEFSLNPNTDFYGRSLFYPRYNVGASISLGMFVNIPFKTRQDRERVVMAEAQLDNQKLEIRNAVLKAYNEYLLRERVYKIQTQLLSDIENSHKLLEQRFKNGETTFEQYSLSQANYNNSTIALLGSERDYKNSKLDLEKLIGLKLEDVR
jgi:outer membrane protein TolC